MENEGNDMLGHTCYPLKRVEELFWPFAAPSERVHEETSGRILNDNATA